VPAPEIETLVIKALRDRLATADNREQLTDDRDLFECQLGHVVVKPQAIEIHLARSNEREERTSIDNVSDFGSTDLPQTIVVPWSAAAFTEVKGILHSPSPRPTLRAETREALLTAIAKARIWINELVEGRLGSFCEIAKREGKVERHIRLLTPLAFVSPRIIAAIMDDSAPADLTVTGLAQPLAFSWTE
jgi:site-specific DNA recombinase